MSTNARYGSFFVFCNKAQRKTCFACGRETVSIHIFHIYGIIWWNSIWKFCTYCCWLENL